MSGTSRTYVLDTSVLLSDPSALRRFEEHAVVIPLATLTELEGKRHHLELGWAARSALRALEELREEHGSLLDALAVNDAGGTVRVELNHTSRDVLPDGFRDDTNDNRILSVAANLAEEGASVVLVSKDLPLRLKAGVVGLEASEFRDTDVADDGWTGFTDVMVDSATVDDLYAEGVCDLAEARDLPVNTGIALVAGSQSGLGRVHADKRVHRIIDRPVFDVRARSAEQHVALDLLTDDRVGIVSLGGRAGTGKSVLALAAALDAVLEQRSHSRVVIFRPLYAVGGQDLGYLPGSESEKMSPWAAAVNDALEAIAGPEVVDEVIHRELLEVLPLTHIRGRSITDTFVIVDEAQNLERNVLLTALTRVGENTKVVLTHDVAQRDNLRVGRYDGIGAVVDHLRGHPLFGHVTLTRSERSEVAALVAGLLDGRD